MGAGAMLYDVRQHRQINMTTHTRTDTIKDTQTEIWTLWPQRQVGDEKLKNEVHKDNDEIIMVSL